VETCPHGPFGNRVRAVEEVSLRWAQCPRDRGRGVRGPGYPAFAARKTVATRSDGTEEPEEDTGDDPELGAVLRGGYRFEPLPRSRQEVETIAGLYAPRSVAFLGEQATEKHAISIGRDVPLIHYACHAYVNERFPLDSALVFTIPEKPKEGQDNGLLQAWEIFEKMRIDADLVTLSACETGLGKEMGGEGLIGLTRAFQYAGARSVLASLWKVEDASTAELMKRFYGYLKAGKTKDEALRLAQIDLIHRPNSSQPRDWAAFDLMGDWK
jgi:CHAT domain-containing protein